MSARKLKTGFYGAKDYGYNYFAESIEKSFPDSSHSTVAHCDQNVNDYNDIIELDGTSNHVCAPLEISTPFEKPASRFYSSICAKRRLIFAEMHPANVCSLDEGIQLKKQRQKLCNGAERLDLIVMLEYFPIIEIILQMLSSRELQTMSLVSRRWRKIVFSSRKASKRLRHFHIKQISFKENSRSTPCVLNKQSSNYFSFSNERNEFYNAIHRSSDHGNNIQDDFITNQKVVKTLRNNEHLVKCPRCGKGSKIQYTEDISSSSVEEIENECSKTLPINSINSDCKNMFRRFFSVDLNINSFPHFQNENNSFGECTGIKCSYRFCLKCCGIYHPGELCNLSELRTPSKIQLNKNKKTNRPSGKLKRTALKRLCF